MTNTGARTVLIVSGLNSISREFHRFPEKPLGIIELRSSNSNFGLRRGLRALLKLFRPDRYMDCASYCRRHRLQHTTIQRPDIGQIDTVLTDWKAELLVAYSVPIIPMTALSGLKYGAINLHHAELPRYRGGNPLLWQVIEGERNLGVTVHTITAGADEGDVLLQRTIKRPYGITRQALTDFANQSLGVDLLREAIPDWVSGSSKAIAQPIKSPTIAANHFSFDRLLTILSDRETTLSGLWDVAQFQSYWPAESIPNLGWQNYVRWKPTSLIRDCESHDAKNHKRLEFCVNGMKLHLHHEDGCVVFAPRLHATTLIARLLIKRTRPG